jgi:Immunity protein 53
MGDHNRLKMAVKNDRSQAIDFVIEPWGDIRALSPGAELAVSYEDRGERFSVKDGERIGKVNLALCVEDDCVLLWSEGVEGLLDWFPSERAQPPTMPPQMGLQASQADPLAALQEWYLSRCDGDWEHSYGITVATLDNPGWSLKVELANTPLADVRHAGETVERSEHDWMRWEVDDDGFVGACGPLNLGDLIEAFLALSRS